MQLKENRLFEILDARVVKEGEKEEIMKVGNLAKRCLNLNGKKRPTMKEVAIELSGIRSTNGAFTVQGNYEELDFVDDDANRYFETEILDTPGFYYRGNIPAGLLKRLRTIVWKIEGRGPSELDSS
ncbi:hypothetical protein Patl1_32026 [Pistacia atlantica]|uniref:Uncharacterized protein n=1 Tax=Pistacia atlantica TaxID=434234 RepID=A0ACC1AQC1_9ROSI|nr:hypothetical protein Patl1_32026 [Pistacia atlantica]